MAQGIALPLKVEAGRLKLLSGDDYLKQLIAMVLGDNESENPFQNLGLGEWMTFALNDEVSDGEARQRVKAAFSELEKDQLARLDALTFEDGDEGERIMHVAYIDLETGRRESLDVPLPPASTE